MLGCAESVKGNSMVMIRGRILSGDADVGVVALKEWASEYFSACIFWMDFGF